MTAPRKIAVVALLAVVVLVVTVVVVLQRREAAAAEQQLSNVADLGGQRYVVGGKNNFEEQDLLCRITVAALRAARADAVDRCGTGSTATTRQALLDGTIDVYWEYTGTAWSTFFGETQRITDAGRLHDLVAQRDRGNGVVWTARADVDNTYAFAMNGEQADRLRIGSISDMARYVASGAPGTVCVEPEYRDRPDGLANLQRAYGFTLPASRLRVLPAGDVYPATARGECLFGEVYSTDGRIPGLALRVLTDDKGYHGVYNPTPTMRADVFGRNPAVARVLDTVARRLDQPTMLALNGEVSSAGRDPREVAQRWLSDTGLVPAE